MNTMNDLMLHFLQDIYYAEKKGISNMAKVAKVVQNPELKQAILTHREQSQSQVQRLDQVFAALGKRPRGKTCAAMDGLVEEAEEAIGDSERGPVLDAALIACGQAIDHYEIARYGAMVAYARSLGNNEAVELLQQILQEEKENDARMNEIAERTLNPQAAESEGEDEEDNEGEDEEPEDAAEEPPAKPARGRRAAAASKPAAAAKPAPAKKPARRTAAARK